MTLATGQTKPLPAGSLESEAAGQKNTVNPTAMTSAADSKMTIGSAFRVWRSILPVRRSRDGARSPNFYDPGSWVTCLTPAYLLDVVIALLGKGYATRPTSDLLETAAPSHKHPNNPC